jgi:transcriptional regulator with XRE-family HTH domain
VSINQQLRAARKRARLTQAELAKLIGVSLTRYQRLETGRRMPHHRADPLPTDDELTQLCIALGCRPEAIGYEYVDVPTVRRCVPGYAQGANQSAHRSEP